MHPNSLKFVVNYLLRHQSELLLEQSDLLSMFITSLVSISLLLHTQPTYSIKMLVVVIRIVNFCRKHIGVLRDQIIEISQNPILKHLVASFEPGSEYRFKRVLTTHHKLVIELYL